MRWRVEFFKDLVGSEGRAFSSLQQSVVIDRADNGDHAVEAAKRWYEQLCRVPSGRYTPIDLSWRVREKESAIIRDVTKLH
jgi:hypothetical protein